MLSAGLPADLTAYNFAFPLWRWRALPPQVVLMGSTGKAADTPLQLTSPPGDGSLRLRGASGMLSR
jgi:hypothetical protein